MKMSLRKILEDAGRYDDVTKILEDIVKNIVIIKIVCSIMKLRYSEQEHLQFVTQNLRKV